MIILYAIAFSFSAMIGLLVFAVVVNAIGLAIVRDPKDQIAFKFDSSSLLHD